MKKNHWAENLAEKIIKVKGDKEIYTVASGITPSGVVHIGNFRELITVDLIKRALEKRGKKVRFIFSWDDYDVFRKVPKNTLNNQEKDFASYIGRPISSIPDPFSNEGSYAAFFEKKMERSLLKAGIHPEYLYQHQKYQNGQYKEKVKLALQKRNEIINILNSYREVPLSDNWYPINVYCQVCNYNQVEIKHYDGNDMIAYRCIRCERDFMLNLQKEFNLKLLWRIDWPMRWQYEKVDFEPGGKDHSSDGGSYATAKIISQKIFDYEPPVYLQYDFVITKGEGSKLSSSKGNVISLDDVLTIYDPRIVRWIFSSYRNNVDFSIAFDLDVIKTYEAYDRSERQYYGLEEISNSKKEKNKFIFEIAQLKGDFYNHKNQQFPFRHLANIFQIFDFSVKEVINYYKKKSKLNAQTIQNLKLRLGCIKNWIENYAPEKFKFIINKEKKVINSVGKGYKEAVLELRKSILDEKFKDKEKALSDYLYFLLEKYSLDNKDFFKYIYQLLIGKEQGPKLAHFLTIIDKKKISVLLG